MYTRERAFTKGPRAARCTSSRGMTPVTIRDTLNDANMESGSQSSQKPLRVSLTWLLGAVALLAALLFALSVVSLSRLMHMSSEQRQGRARDLVQAELARLAEDPDPGSGLARSPILGLRGGVVRGAPFSSEGGGDAEITVRSGLNRDVDRALATLAAVAGEEHGEAGSLDIDDGTVFFGARRRADGRAVWAAYSVASRPAGPFRLLFVVLASATVLLGLIATVAVVGATRGARALGRSLAALEADLTAPIPRPALAELASVADGLASLARSLEESQRERELLSAELGKQERLAALGRVVAGVAHEVRNPLAAMKLRVDIARGADHVPAEVVAELDAVDEEITRLDRLLTDFLVVSGRRLGRREETDLGQLSQRRASLLAPLAKERGVELEVSGSARAVVDPDALARAVDNLVKNAIEASLPGASVRVRVEPRGGGAAVAVEDLGPGVPEDRVGELFEPLFTTKSEGTGLGLAVTRAIAAASGGSVSYRREGGVTRFELCLEPGLDRHGGAR